MNPKQPRKRSTNFSTEISTEEPASRSEDRSLSLSLRKSTSETKSAKNLKSLDSPGSLEPIKPKASQQNETNNVQKPAKLPSYLNPTYHALQLKKDKLDNGGDKRGFTFSRRKTKVLDVMDWQSKLTHLLDKNAQRNLFWFEHIIIIYFTIANSLPAVAQTKANIETNVMNITKQVSNSSQNKLDLERTKSKSPKSAKIKDPSER